MSFAEGVAVVTGAASGIGRAVVLELLRKGADVAALDRDPAGLKRLEVQARELTPGAKLYLGELDVTEAASVTQTVQRLEAERGPVQWVVSAAGVLRPGPLLDAAASEALTLQYDVHVRGLWNLMQAVGPRLVMRKQGSVVAISSNAGSTPRLGMGAYAASKAATTMLMKCFALELAPHVRCNVVAPGSTNTSMLRSFTGEEGYQRLIEGDAARFKLGIPLGRVAEPEDVAQAVLFLLSSEARHITGHELTVDGGATP